MSGAAPEHALRRSEQRSAAGGGAVFRTRNLLDKQRTHLGNAVRGRMAEYSRVAPKGTAHLATLADLFEGGEIGDTLPEAARPMFTVMIDMLAKLGE